MRSHHLEHETWIDMFIHIESRLKNTQAGKAILCTPQSSVIIGGKTTGRFV
jgi:hypothetical protein